MWVSNLILLTLSVEVSRAAPVNRQAIIGIFDAVTGLTHGIGDVLEDIALDDDDNDVVIVDRKDLELESNEEEDDKEVYDSNEVIDGLFESLRQFTTQVGKLAHVVGDRLEDRRGNVVRLADRVDSQVDTDYPIDTFGIHSTIYINRSKIWERAS